MTEITAIVYGCEEEKDPITTCPDCGVLPHLDINVQDPIVHFCFFCPVCGARAAATVSVRTAKKNWNLGNAEIRRDQKRMDDF